jgi:hypothetical protein
VSKRAAAAGLFIMAVARAEAGEPAPALEPLLASAARYVAAYEQEFAYLVAEERYVQKLSVGVSVRRVRELRSDIAFVPLATPMRWTAFRDVYEMDGKPVADRRALLKKLFIDPAPNAVVRAAEVLDTSARFNLGRWRNVNIPTLALVFLHEANQRRFAFERKGDDELSGVTGWKVAFKETASPTFVRDPVADRDIRCRGFVWITADGRVLRSTIRLGDPSVEVEVDVRFGPWEGSTIWMPTSMTDSYTGPWVGAGSGRGASTERLVASARYENFRRYQVHIESEGATK